MRNFRHRAEVGDRFQLFGHFLYDFGEDLPIALAPEVEFAMTPQSVLDNAKPRELASFVLPGYHLPGAGLVHCCLRHPLGSPAPPDMRVETLFMQSVAAFRLLAPLAINVAGGFELGQDFLFNRLYLLNMNSPWQPVSGVRYSGQSVRRAAAILERTRKVQALGAYKVAQAMNLFVQVTCGYGRTWHMAYFTLWSALEYLLQPSIGRGRTYHENLATRLACVLSAVPQREWLVDWASREYQRGRHGRIHGTYAPSASPTTPSHGIEGQTVEVPREVEPNPMGVLHEIVRLGVLYFLGLSAVDLRTHSNANRPNLTRWFAGLDAKDSSFMREQCAWVDDRRHHIVLNGQNGLVASG